VPWRAPADALWDKVELGEWRLIGPRLAGVIVLLALRMRRSRARIRELLRALFGLSLSTGLVDQTIREAGRASEPLEETRVAEIQQAAQLHVDETSGPKPGQCYGCGRALSRPPRERRLRRLSRLAQPPALLAPSAAQGARADRIDRRAHRAGRRGDGSVDAHADGGDLRGAPKTPPEPLPIRYAAEIERLRKLCEAHHGDAHDALRSFARELHPDWDVIVRPLAEPHRPLSDHAAEQALRHWVISRRIRHGTRCPAGSRAFAVLASVVETCRLRGACIGRYLAEVIQAARKGAALPGLPNVPARAQGGTERLPNGLFLRDPKFGGDDRSCFSRCRSPS
jgi:hypothetical protein